MRINYNDQNELFIEVPSPVRNGPSRLVQIVNMSYAHQHRAF